MNRILGNCLILFFSFFSISGCGAEEIEKNSSFADIQLSDIRESKNLWKILESQNSLNSDVKNEISKSVIKNLILVRSISPDINKLSGESLETLCLLMGEDGREMLINSRDDQLLEMANEYLSSIENSVKARISDMQKTMRGKGCYISPHVQ